MMKKKTVHKTESLKLGLIAVLVVALLSTGFYVRSLMENLPKADGDDPIVKQVYTVTLNDYKVYQFTDILYDFILANVTVTSNKAFTLPQDPFTTSENINLVNVPEYADPLTSKGYQLNCPLPASEAQLSKTYCLFIPAVNRSLNELILKVDIDRIYNLSFNMNDVGHAGTRTMLGVVEPVQDFTAVILDKSLISIKSFYTVDINGDHLDAAFGSTSQVFGFQLTLENKSNKPFKIEEAQLTIDGKGTYQLVDPTYLIDEMTNLYNVDIPTMKSGYLFFDIPDETVDLYALQNAQIHLMIKLSTYDSFIEVLFMENTQ